MRKKFQDRMFEISYLFELFISVIVGVAILLLGIRLAIDTLSISMYSKGISGLVEILDDAIILAIGAELIKMLCKHTPETIIEVLAFALARQLIVGHTAPWENLVTVFAIAVLFAVRKFLLKRKDMVETPDGLVEVGATKTEEE
ncbi:MAG: transporter [Clostridia bacterium]|nr:transporter [Clostridia bacterium]